MTETAGMSSEEAAAARAAEQARIRKERREAKIKAGGSARLNKITGLGGGVQRDPIPSFSPEPTSTAPPASATAQPQSSPAAAAAAAATSEQHHGDPEEVDISQHYYQPNTTNRIPPPSSQQGLGGDISEAQLRQMMLGFDRPQTPNGTGAAGAGGMPQNPFFDPSMFANMMGGASAEGGPGGPAAGADDPMMKMLTQMMGGAGAGAGGPGTNSPFGGANPFAGMQQAQAQKQLPDSYAAIWRVLHFILAMGLGLYIALFTGFLGTKVERERSTFAATTGATPDPHTQDLFEMKKYFFWTFATAETVLLTTRFFLDRSRNGASGSPGMLWTIMGFLPDSKWKTYVATGLRYSQIFSTVRSDILTCVFVLGAASYLRS